jgi:hypothetical protein
MNARFASAGVAVLLLAACASTLAPPPPVKVVVTATPSLDKLIDVAWITSETESALRHLAPAASPSTVSVRFISRKTPFGSSSGCLPSLFVGGVDSCNSDAAISAVTVHPPGVISQPVLYGTYTITDANGRTLEERAVFIEPGRDQWVLAMELAKRVAAVAHGS